MLMGKKTKLLVILALAVSITSAAAIGCGTSDNVNNADIIVSDNEETADKNEVSYSKGVEQNTSYGAVKGYEENNGQTLIWKGVPYAKGPVGDLRWKAPEDPTSWEGVLDSTEAGNLGVQLSNGEIIGSEDCLNLDIYRPNTDEENLPVLLFIHGGNNQTGTSSEIDPSDLAIKANCIVVSVNYRLGVLGFNNLPALKTGDANEDSGNYTLLDIAKSLDWIKENIEGFGGSSENITASGFSAGGRDIMAMLISPIFEGKFQKAIAFSGGMTVADSEESTKVIAKAIAPLVVEDKVKENEDEAYTWLLSEDEDVKEYLYSVSSDRLARLMGNAAIRMSVFPHLFEDGVVIPEEGFDTTNYNDVPLMMVTGSTEFSMFAKGDPYFETLSKENNEELEKELDFAVNYGSRLYGLFNAEESASKMSKNYKSSIYTCDFDFGTSESIEGGITEYGSYHGVFIPFLTGRTTGAAATFPESFEGNGVLDLADNFTSYVSNFLRTGNPNGEGLVTWDSWSENGASQLILDVNEDKAVITMSDSHETYDNIIGDMENDTTISEESKENIIKNVLNGRWFSKGLDEHFGNESLWVE